VLNKRPTVHDGHHQIEPYHVWRYQVQTVKSLASVASNDDRVASIPQLFGEQVSDAGVIVNQDVVLAGEARRPDWGLEHPSIGFQLRGESDRAVGRAQDTSHRRLAHELRHRGLDPRGGAVVSAGAR